MQFVLHECNVTYFPQQTLSVIVSRMRSSRLEAAFDEVSANVGGTKPQDVLTQQYWIRQDHLSSPWHDAALQVNHHEIPIRNCVGHAKNQGRAIVIYH